MSRRTTQWKRIARRSSSVAAIIPNTVVHGRVRYLQKVDKDIRIPAMAASLMYATSNICSRPAGQDKRNRMERVMSANLSKG